MCSRPRGTGGRGKTELWGNKFQLFWGHPIFQFGILFRGRSEKHQALSPFCTISDTGGKAQGRITQLIAVIPGFHTMTLACVQCMRVWCMHV